MCADLGKAGVVPLLSALWTRWEDDEIRQLVLWAMGEVARLGKQDDIKKDCMPVQWMT